MITDVTAPLSPRAFHDRIYAGEILCFRALPAMQALVGFTQAFAEAALAPYHPTRVHEDLSKSAQREGCGAYQQAYAESGEAKAHWAALYEAIGLGREGLACDRVIARVQTHDPSLAPSGRDLETAPLAFHRDTWGSNLYAQVNWWAPVYPVTAGRTMEIYPALWRQALRNSSPAFDLPEVIGRRRKAEAAPLDVDAVIPHVSEAVDPALGRPVLIEPGDILAFSGAHAHRSVPNATGLSRLSLDTRTLWIADVEAGRGAANLDGAAFWQAPGWFRRLSDGTRLSDLLGCARIARYDPPDEAVAGAKGISSGHIDRPRPGD